MATFSSIGKVATAIIVYWRSGRFLWVAAAYFLAMPLNFGHDKYLQV
jgi:hypothetical protein